MRLQDAIADREKHKVDLWLQKEVHQGEQAGEMTPEELRTKFEEYKSLGEKYAEAGDAGPALVAWDEALLLKGIESAVSSKVIATVNEYEAQLLMEMEDYFGALHTCERALEICPEYMVALHTKGRAQLEMGELTMAMQTLTAARDANCADTDQESLVEDITRCEDLQAKARDLEAETGGQVLRGQLVLPGEKWQKSCYGSRVGKPGEMNCDTRNRLYLSLLMSKALDVSSAAVPEDYVSNQTSNVYGLIPVRVGCPVSDPMRRDIQCCLSLEPLNKLLGQNRSTGLPSLRFPTSICRDGETPVHAARRAYQAQYGDKLGPAEALWQPQFLSPITNYRKQPSGETEVQTFYVVICPPEIIPATVSDANRHFANLYTLVTEDPAAALALVRETQTVNRWSPRQVSHAIVAQLAEGIVKAELKPADDGWFNPAAILNVAETMFDREPLQALFRSLIASEPISWSDGLLAAVELLCISWNLKASLVPILEELLYNHGLVEPAAMLAWFASDPRRGLIEFVDGSTEDSRIEMLLGVHGYRTEASTSEFVASLREKMPAAAAAHDAAHVDERAEPVPLWAGNDSCRLIGEAAAIVQKIDRSLHEAAAAGLMSEASPDWDRLAARHGKGGDRGAAPAAGGRGQKRKRVVHSIDTDIDLLIIGAGASGIGCAVQAKAFGIEPSRTLIVDRADRIGATFEQWPAEMRFISPSFNQQVRH